MASPDHLEDLLFDQFSAKNQKQLAKRYTESISEDVKKLILELEKMKNDIIQEIQNDNSEERPESKDLMDRMNNAKEIPRKVNMIKLIDPIFSQDRPKPNKNGGKKRIVLIRKATKDGKTTVKRTAITSMSFQQTLKFAKREMKDKLILKSMANSPDRSNLVSGMQSTMS
jgi:hypothetical protein